MQILHIEMENMITKLMRRGIKMIKLKIYVTRVSDELKAIRIEAESHICQYCGTPLEPRWDDEDNLSFDCPECECEMIEVV